MSLVESYSTISIFFFLESEDTGKRVTDGTMFSEYESDHKRF